MASVRGSAVQPKKASVLNYPSLLFLPPVSDPQRCGDIPAEKIYDESFTRTLSVSIKTPFILQALKQ
jgi:hypothetical protein